MDHAELRRAIATTLDGLAGFEPADGLEALPVVDLAAPKQIADELDVERLLQDGLGPSGLAAFVDRYLARSIRLHHPRSMAHQVAAPDVSSAVAELMHGATNNPMAIYEMGPAAATLELAVLHWMARHLGWPTPELGAPPAEGETAGVLTHGGSLANLTALAAARARAAGEVWETGVTRPLGVLAAPSTHYSVRRAAAVLGMGASNVLPLATDDLGVVIPDAVAEAVEGCRRRGITPVAVVASAPATATGLHDPLRPIAEACRAADVWLHVDAAHGASALLSPALRPRLDGIGLADSVTWDAHKMLRAAGLAAAVLFREGRWADRAFQHEASYLPDDAVLGPNLIGRTVECTKAELGTKVFLSVAWHGEQALARYVEGRYAAARELHRLVTTRPGFSAPFVPESNIVCFRRDAPDFDAEAVRRHLLEAGTFHVSTAEVAGRPHLRTVLMAPATDRATFEALLAAIEERSQRNPAGPDAPGAASATDRTAPTAGGGGG